MYIKGLIAVFFVMVLFMGGCSSSDPEGTIDLACEDDVSIHDIFSEVRIIMPETHSDYLIATMSSIEYHKDRYYIFDNKSQQVFCVDENGRFHFKISAQGHGPGEYVYLGHMSIDRFNDQILLLEPSMQRLQVFDLEGEHVQTYSITGENIQAYNYSFALNRSTLVLIANSHDQLIYYCRDSQKILHTCFPFELAHGTHPFSPSSRSFYQYNNRAYYLPNLSQQVADITEMHPETYYTWDFGADNNSENQYKSLIDEIAERGHQESFVYQHEAVGRGKFLNHNIIKVAETKRYKIAIVEFDTDWKNVIIDKKEDVYYVFRAFKEGISLTYLNISGDIVLGLAGEFDYVAPDYRQRVLSRFHPSVLSETDKMRINDWDEMKDNPFFVVYKFRD